MVKQGKFEWRSQQITSWGILILITAAALLVGGSVYLAARSIDAEIATRQQAKSQRVIDNLARRISREQQSVAFWNGARQRIRAAPGEARLRDDLTAYLRRHLGYAATFVVRQDGSTITGSGPGRHGAPLIPQGLRKMVASLRDALKQGQARIPDGGNEARQTMQPGTVKAGFRHVSDLVQWRGTPALVHASTMVPDGDRQPGPGQPALLITVTALTPKVMLDAGTDLGLFDLRWQAPETETGSPHALVTSRSGAPIGHLTWRADRPGMMIIRQSMPAFVAAFALLAWFGAIAIYGSRVNLQKLASEKARAEFLANHDQLTGLFNRRYLDRTLDRLMRHAATDEPFAFLSIDLDGFKTLNDLLGHDAGDQALIAVALRLQNCAPDAATVARIGGDEFALVLPGVSASDAAPLADDVCTAIAQPVPLGAGQTRVIGASIGIVEGPAHADTVRDLKRRADIALNHVKENGRSFAKVFEPALEARSLARTMKAAAAPAA